MEDLRIIERTPPWERGGKLPGDRIIAMVLSQLDANAKVFLVAPHSRETADAPDCVIIEGRCNGARQKILVDGIQGQTPVSKERLHRLAAYKISLALDATFFCYSGPLSGEALILSDRMGLVAFEHAKDSGAIKGHVGSIGIARHISIHSWRLSLLLLGGGEKGRSFDDKSQDLKFQGKPLRNWLCRESRKWMQKVNQDCSFAAQYRLKKSVTFECDGRNLEADHFIVSFIFRFRNQAQVHLAELENLEYQPRLKKVLLSGGISNERKGAGGALQERAYPLRPSTASKPDLHIYHPIESSAASGLPDLDRHIQSITTNTAIP